MIRLAVIDALGTPGPHHYSWYLCDALNHTKQVQLLLITPTLLKPTQFQSMVHGKHTIRTVSPLIRLFWYTKWIVATTRTIIRMKPDIVHWQFNFFCVLDAVATLCMRACNQRLRVMYTVHDIQPARKTFNNTFMRNFFIALSDGYILHSPEALQTFFSVSRIQSIVSKPTAVIPIGPIPFTDISQTTTRSHILNRYGFPEHARVLVTVGTQNENKDFAASLRIIDLLHKQHQLVRYVVAGQLVRSNINDDPELFERMRKNNIIVVINSFVSESEAFDLHTIADFSLLMYKSSASSASAIRSLNAGVPVICNRLDGFTSLIQEAVNGIFIDTKHPQQAISYIVHALQSPTIMKDFAERARISSSHVSWHDIARKTIDFYTSHVQETKS